MDRLSAFAFVLLLIAACGPVQDTPPRPASTVAGPAPAVVDPNSIYLFDGNMERSSAFRLEGDLRPLWIVSGRIRNDSATELKSVTVKISIISSASSNELDTAQLTVDSDIPPGSVVSFKRGVQLLPPSSGWRWSWTVTEAVPK